MTIAHIFNGELGFDVRAKLNDVIDIANAGGSGGGGTTILDGSGPPADATGATGDYYVDNTGNQLYGPKSATPITSYGPDQNAIPTSLVAVHAGNGNYELSNHVKALAAGRITAVRYWRDSTTTQVARTVNVWTTGGTLLSSGSVANDGGGTGWKQITLTTPVSMAINAVVIVSVGNTADYVQLTATYPISNGGDLNIINGAYGAPSGTFPNNNIAVNYFTDVVFQKALPTTLWPMAVDGDALSIGNAITSSTSGSVLFVGSGNNLAQDNANFFWDDTLKDLHIGGAYYVSAARALYVVPASPENNWFEGNAGNQTLTGYGNFGTGDLSLSTLTSGFNNVAMGTSALKSCTSGNHNFALGSAALRFTQADGDNIAIGQRALETLGNAGAGGGGNGRNVAMGFAAMANAEQAGNNIAMGYTAMSGVGGSTNASFNTVIGSNAGGSLGSGGGANIEYNTFLGSNAATNLTGTSSRNTWIGGYRGPSAIVNGTTVLSDGDGVRLFDCGLTTPHTWSIQYAGNYEACGFHIYGLQNPPFTTSNYVRVSMDYDADFYGGGTFWIHSQAGGSGVKRLIAIDGFAKAGAPAAGDLPAGSFSVIDDTSGGATWLVFNKAGTIRKVQLT